MEINAVAAWINTVFAGFDQWAASFVHNLYTLGGGFFTPFFQVMGWLGAHGIFLIVLSLVLLAIPKTRRYGTAMALGLAIGAIITNLILKTIVARPRPYSEETAKFFNTTFFQSLWEKVGQMTESDKSFPSGHTTAAFASMVALFLMGNKKVSWMALIFAVLMAISRIYLMVHFATDVVGGLLVGIPSGIAAAAIAKHLPQAYYDFDFGISKRRQKKANA